MQMRPLTMLSQKLSTSFAIGKRPAMPMTAISVACMPNAAAAGGTAATATASALRHDASAGQAGGAMDSMDAVSAADCGVPKDAEACGTAAAAGASAAARSASVSRTKRANC